MSAVEPHRATITVEWHPNAEEPDLLRFDAAAASFLASLFDAGLITDDDKVRWSATIGGAPKTPAFDNAVEVLANGLRRRRHTAYSDEGLAAYLLQSLTLGPDPLATLVDPDNHVYISTACLHGNHDACRLTCKFCDSRCACPVCDHKDELG